MSSSLPIARVDGLVISRSSDELLVYDSGSNQLHHLDALTAEVWRRCDGVTLLADAVRLIQAEVGASVSITSVRLAISLLEERQLLASTPDPDSLPSVPRRAGRRSVLKAAAGVAIPVVVSVTAPMAATASSGCAEYQEPCGKYEDCCHLMGATMGDATTRRRQRPGPGYLNG